MSPIRAIFLVAALALACLAAVSAQSTGSKSGQGPNFRHGFDLPIESYLSTRTEPSSYPNNIQANSLVDGKGQPITPTPFYPPSRFSGGSSARGLFSPSLSGPKCHFNGQSNFSYQQLIKDADEGRQKEIIKCDNDVQFARTCFTRKEALSSSEDSIFNKVAGWR